MLALMWLKGLVVRHSGRLAGVALGVALTVALLAALGAFITSSAAMMTDRAIASVPVDWQVQLAPGADAGAVTAAIGQATPYTALDQVGYADSAGFSAQAGGTVQTTGPGKVLGISPQYQQLFSSEIRPLVGATDGVLVAQQTAANLHVAPGDTVTIDRVGLPPVTVTVAGVVDLPNADSLFQAVGVPVGAAPQAPPDNVLLLPIDQWHTLFDPQAAARPDSVRIQLHVRIGHDLPADPNAAYVRVQQTARNIEARVAGSALVGDNLAVRLGGARADALYARVLFLFLGTPGAVLAVLLTVAVAASGGERRRREQALLRTRGASVATVLRLAGLEGLAAGFAGAALGVALAALATATIAPAAGGTGAGALVWMAAAALAGLGLALAVVLWPAWAEARRGTVAGARAVVGRRRAPLWQRVYLDVAALTIAAVAFWQTASGGYQVVLAPEGVPQTSVSYQAFLAPLFLWVGVGLLAMRLWSDGLNRGRRVLAWLLRPLARGLSGIVAASIGRQRALVTRGVVLVALAFSFATATAVFNSTYNAQSRVDAQLTNGADVAVTGSTSSPPGSKLADLRALSGVAAAQPMQHRFAYVGNDLQDIYGIDPARIGDATAISDAYFAGGNARATLATLAATPDGVLVAEETVKDFQLKSGDTVNLRLQSAADQQYRVVPFRFIGVVREFPTAPKDSFLVVNASYIAQQTGTDAAEIVLLRASGSPTDLAARARPVVASLAGATVTDIGTTQRTISSSLTAVDLRGLTRLELAFAVVLLAGATGLVLALGLAERRRTFAILSALGAKGGQLSAFLWGEALLILLSGALVGSATGFGVAQMLVKLLTGVFDPPPQSLTAPWLYLALLAAAAAASTAAAVLAAQAAARRRVVESLRGL